MISHDRAKQPNHSFQVQVGYASVTVQGVSRQDAIQQARMELCREMPRMWDIIHHMEDSRFQVNELK